MGQIALIKVHLQSHGVDVFKVKPQHFAIDKLNLSKCYPVDIAQAYITISEFTIGELETAQIQIGKIAKGESAVFEVVVG